MFFFIVNGDNIDRILRELLSSQTSQKMSQYQYPFIFPTLSYVLNQIAYDYYLLSRIYPKQARVYKLFQILLTPIYMFR